MDSSQRDAARVFVFADDSPVSGCRASPSAGVARPADPGCVDCRLTDTC